MKTLGVLSLLVFVGLVGCTTETEVVANQLKHMELAKKWCTDHRIVGEVSCERSALTGMQCDVVPSDTRSPFSLRCFRNECRLLTPGEKP